MKVWIIQSGRWGDSDEVAWRVSFDTFRAEDGDNVPEPKSRRFPTEAAAVAFAKKVSKRDVSAFAMAAVQKQSLEHFERNAWDWTDTDDDPIYYNDGEISE